ncbi:MAG: alpha/beta hydrolase [Pseudomonadota bacterium]
MRMIMSLFLFLVVFALLGASGCANLGAEKRAPKLGQTITVDGVDMHVLTAGEKASGKPPVLLIHGASVNLRDMKIALGDALGEDRFVVMVDRPGRGYSERPPNGYELQRQAALIKAAADAVGAERPIVVGQSFGGAVALNYALQFEDEMSGLVLLAPVSHEWPGGVAWYNSVSETPVIGFLFRRMVIPVYGAMAGRESVNESFAPDEPPQNYYDRAGVPLLFRAADFKANAADIKHLKEQIRLQQEEYAKLQIPVKIMAGTDDKTVLPRIHAKALEEQIDQATLKMLPDTGHALHHAETAAILSVIDNLTAEIERGGALAQ